MLGLYNEASTLVSVGVIGAFPMARRRELFAELQPLVTDFEEHPWNWAAHEAGERTPRKGEDRGGTRVRTCPSRHCVRTGRRGPL